MFPPSPLPATVFLLLFHSISLAYFSDYWPALALESLDRLTDHFLGISALVGDCIYLFKFSHEGFMHHCGTKYAFHLYVWCHQKFIQQYGRCQSCSLNRTSFFLLFFFFLSNRFIFADAMYK